MNIGEKFYCSKCMCEIENEDICPYCGHRQSDENSIHLLEEGALLQNGRYQIGSAIGEGGFGITYAAWDLVLNQPVAMKEYYPMNICSRDTREDYSVIPSPEYQDLYQIGLQRFIREARILGTLQNVKNVVPVLEWFEKNNTAYIVMKFIRGVTLEKYVNEKHIPPQQLIEMLRDLIDSLILVHAQGILHRDISPTNIMVQEDGTLILIDFGAATSEERKAQGKDRTVIYNKSFAPVEQYDESGIQGPWTDIYALSATIYYLVTGEFPVESVSRIAKDTLQSPKKKGIPLKKWQDQAIMGGLAVQPENRPQTMGIFRSMLYHLPMPEEVQRRKRFWTLTAAAAALLILLNILITVNFTFGFPLKDGVLYSLQRDGWHIKGSSINNVTLELSDSLLGIDVIQIEANAFQGSQGLIEVTIPGSVKTVREYAFNNCKNLTSVIIKDGVQHLSSQVFSNCSSLQGVTIPKTVTSFEADTFAFPSNRLVLLVDDPAGPIAGMAEDFEVNYAYVETSENDTGITVSRYETEQNKALIPDQINGLPVTIVDSGIEKTAVFPSEVSEIILPEYLEKIGDYSAYHTQINSIDFPKGVSSIGEHAFAGTLLQAVALPESLTDLGKGAFAFCLGLQTVDLSPNIGKIPSGCFEGDQNLTNINIPEGISEIQTLAFGRCASLSALRLPDGMTTIGNLAFEDCVSLGALFIPDSVNTINPAALNGCSNAITIIGYGNTFAENFSRDMDYSFYNMSGIDPYFSVSKKGGLFVLDGARESDKVDLPSFYNEIIVKKVTDARAIRSENVTMPRFTEIVGGLSFSNNQYLKTISAPETLKTIEMMAFAGSDHLRDVILQDGVKEIGMMAFHSCDELENIDLPASVNVIRDAAFMDCKNLKQIHIPYSLVILNNDVFAGSGLTSVTIPGNISKLRTSFYGCKELKTAVLEEGVRTLWGTFAECSSLENVVIPSTVQQISRSTFLHCGNLKDVWIYSDNAELDSVLFSIQHNEYSGTDYMDLTVKTKYLEENNDTPLFGNSPNLTIHAHSGSTAEQYAMEHGINFEAIPDTVTVRSD